jgi:hypothetical protein
MVHEFSLCHSELLRSLCAMEVLEMIGTADAKAQA